MEKSADIKAYNYIRKAIIQRELFPNEQIVEQQVAEKTGVSRTPIRNALKRLSYEGMVVIRPNKGAFVANPSHEEVRDAFECKLLLESEIAKLACLYITDKELEKMETILALEKETHAKKNFEESTDFNYNFHMAIAKACNNKWYEKYLHELMAITNVHLLVYDNFREVPLEKMESFKQHQCIIEALWERNEEKCVQAMIGHNKDNYYKLNLSLPLRTEKIKQTPQYPIADTHKLCENTVDGRQL